MTVHVCSNTATDAIGAAGSCMAQLRAYRGRVPPDDHLLAGGGAGWLIATLGRRLAFVVDSAFPYTRPKVYLRGELRATPHVERDGRLCLRNPEVPSDPARAMMAAVHAARELLRAIDDGSEDGDFEEDFGLYWRHAASDVGPVRLLLPGADRTGVVSWTATNASCYAFESTALLRKWWRHRFLADPPKVRQAALIALDVLPHPDEYPSTGADLWDLIGSRSTDGSAVLGRLLKHTPKRLLVILAGIAPSGRRHAVGLLLARPRDPLGRPAKRRIIEAGYQRGKAPPDVLCRRHLLFRLPTEALDAAGNRLPYAEVERLSKACVAVIGCGALGSGVARLLAKSGIGHLILVDPEKLGWENIRRHQLGAGAVGLHKASAMAEVIAHENPEIGSTSAINTSVEHLLMTRPEAFANVDLVVACTAAWSANFALDEFGRSGGPPVLYSWLEAYALAAHAVLVTPGHSYVTGFDEAGNPRITASETNKPAPAECGALTSPFGAIELSHAETLAGRLALDFLRGKITGTTWRTWLADEEALTDAEAHWTPDWIAARGVPNPLGEISTGAWWDTWPRL